LIVSKSLYRLTHWPFFIAYCLFLYIDSTIPGERLPPFVIYTNDEVLHFLHFFILALLAFRTFISSTQSIFCVQSGSKAAAFSVLYGAFLEEVQLTVPGREASLGDWMTDVLGVLAASGIFRISRLTPPP